MTTRRSKRKPAEEQARRRRIAAETRLELCALFPLCFRHKGERKPALKLGIDRDVIEACPDIAPGRIKIAIGDYTRGSTYVESIVAGAYRIDLAGHPAGVISQAEEDYARQRLAAMRHPKKVKAAPVNAAVACAVTAAEMGESK